MRRWSEFMKWLPEGLDTEIGERYSVVRWTEVTDRDSESVVS